MSLKVAISKPCCPSKSGELFKHTESESLGAGFGTMQLINPPFFYAINPQASVYENRVLWLRHRIGSESYFMKVT